jgi:hypothetical protein
MRKLTCRFLFGVTLLTGVAATAQEGRRGRFDREALNETIRDLQGVIERNRLQAHDREFLSEEAARLRRIRERWEGVGGGPEGPRFLGCFRDRDGRDLPGAFIERPNMTVGMCTAHCARSGYTYAGIQDGEQCFCGNSYGRYSASNACNLGCNGNPSERCGGVWANGVFRVR